VAQAEGRSDANIAVIIRMLPEAVGAYRAIVHQLAHTGEVLTDAEYTETRAPVFELLGGRVPVKPRADASAAVALNLDLEPIIKASGSTIYFGSGGPFRELPTLPSGLRGPLPRPQTLNASSALSDLATKL
jgi:hypothetical protein